MYKAFYSLSNDPFLKSVETKEHFKSIDFNHALSRDEAQFLTNSVLDDLRLIFNFEMDSKDYATFN